MRDRASPIRALWLALGFGWLAFVTYLSLVPSPPGASVVPTDVGHVVAYAWLTAWFGQLRYDSRGMLVIAASLLLYGAVIEALQGFTSARQPSLLDVGLNATGVLAGLALVRTPMARTLEAIARRVGRPSGARFRR